MCSEIAAIGYKVNTKRTIYKNVAIFYTFFNVIYNR